jgi:hypothetical protein
MRHLTAFAIAGLVATVPLTSCGVLGPIAPPAPQGGSANFGVYVSLGTSITAGWESGGLVEHHQRQSYACLFARQAGAASFTIPTASADGVPPLLRLASLNPLIISNAGRTAGAFTNDQPTAYHNMAVPYSLLPDLADSTNYYNQFAERNEQFNGIVRHRGTILQQVASLNPTFMSIEYGSNEVLGAASAGSGTPLIPAALFAPLLTATLDGLQALLPQAKLALLTVPDVTSIPFVTTFPPFTVSLTTGQPVPLIGPGGTPLGPGDHVLLTAGALIAVGDGIPVGGFNYLNPSAPGNGNPLPDAVVLSASETGNLQTTVDAYNTAIRAEAAARGAALVDLNGLLAQANASGLPFQGHDYTTDFITGGLFSLDGVHPTDLAHGFIANAMIDAVNAAFGASISPVDLSASATATSSRLRPVAGRRLYPVIEGADRLCPIVPERLEVATR